MPSLIPSNYFTANFNFGVDSLFTIISSPYVAGPAPCINKLLLLDDGTDFLLLDDGTDFLLLDPCIDVLLLLDDGTDFLLLDDGSDFLLLD